MSQAMDRRNEPPHPDSSLDYVACNLYIIVVFVIVGLWPTERQVHAFALTVEYWHRLVPSMHVYHFNYLQFDLLRIWPCFDFYSASA